MRPKKVKNDKVKEIKVEEIKVEEIKQDSNPVLEEKIVQQKKTPWKPDLNRMIKLRSLARGPLTYKSKRINGYRLDWPHTGAETHIELSEFISLKNSDRRFITEPWVRIIEDDEVEILNYCNIYQYYKDLIEVKDIEQLFSMDFEKFKKKFDSLPDGYKNTVMEKAAQMIKSGTLDSIKIKKHIEEKMGVDLDMLASYIKDE